MLNRIFIVMYHLIIQSKHLSCLEILLCLLLLFQEQLHLLFISHYWEGRQEILGGAIHHPTAKTTLERYVVFVRNFHNRLLLIKESLCRPLVSRLLPTHSCPNGIVKAVVHWWPTIECAFLIILKLWTDLIHLSHHMLLRDWILHVDLWFLV